MDIDNIQQNLNTRVVFKEPRGMMRWIQLLFAIIAFSTVVDFYTTVGIDITCPVPTPTPAPAPAPTPTPAPNTTIPTQAPNTTAPGGPTKDHPKLVVTYPFDFSNQVVKNNCSGANYSYTHYSSSLEASPQFFVMTGVLSLIYASASLVVYLLFSSTYSSIPALPVADLIISGSLCLLWLLASSTFASGVNLLKNTVNYHNLEQVICPDAFKMLNGVTCTPSIFETPSWKSINVALVSGFTSSFLWGSGMWFVFKETDIRFVNLNW